MQTNFLPILSNFNFEGEVVDVIPFGSGHINSTFLVKTTKKNYVLQKINNYVFKNVDALMNNVSLVTKYIKDNFPNKKTMSYLTCKNGKTYTKVDDEYFRAYECIEGVVSLDIVTKPEEFYESARAFGEFANELADFDASQLYEVIPNFHNTVDRFNNLKKAILNNKAGRKNKVREEISFALCREGFANNIVTLLNNGQMPLKVTHNDTKLNNVLLDEKTFEPVAVIDLDTVMPGSICYDFGDSIRFGCNSAAEDEKDLSKVTFRLDLFDVYAKGYLEKIGKSITKVEKDNLVIGSIMMTLECGVRFLSDYLDGDVYFNTKYSDHNLDRCHTQFKLVAKMEKCQSEMQSIVDKYYNIYCK